MPGIAGPQAGSSQNTPNPGINLNSPPPLPPEATRQPTLSQLAGPSAPPDNGIGMEGGGQRVQLAQGMASVQQGFRLLATGNPAMAPQLAEFLNQLEKAMVQDLAGQAQQGQLQAQQGGQGAMPPGGAGMPPPQQQMQQQ